MTNGTSYTFTVSASNCVGTGATSAPSNAVTPATVPDAPTAVTATRGNMSASVTWTAPANNGSAVTSYTVTASPGGAATTVSGAPPATTATVTGLTNGTSYTFTVAATNSVGTGSASAPSNAVTPADLVPGVPTLQSPADPAAIAPGDPQQFSGVADTFDGDTYRLVVTVRRSSDGSVAAIAQSGFTASLLTATVDLAGGLRGGARIPGPPDPRTQPGER